MFDQHKDCCGGAGLMPYAECLRLLLAEAHAQEPQLTPLGDAIGLTLADDVCAPISVPSFDNSAMDGFAFSAAAVLNASAARPVQLPIVGASIAGDTAGLSHLGNGHAVKIMTGAPMPEGADTVLPVEAASWDHAKLTFYEPYPRGRHVRHVGQDVRAGGTILKAGTRLEARHLPMLCAVGLGRVPVYPHPRAAWISTGQEICDDLSAPLEPGHIYNATRLYGHAVTGDMGFHLVRAATVRDTPQDFALALEEALEAKPRIIMSTGGVSAGQYDFVKPVLEDFGAEIIFHKAKIKPAKPVLFARLPGDVYFFGLPGNPISTALALRAFVYPFVRALTGLEEEVPQHALLAADIQADETKTVFLMADVRINDQGQLIATPSSRQQSFQTMPFAESNAWVVMPSGTGTLKAGETVAFYPATPAA